MPTGKEVIEGEIEGEEASPTECWFCRKIFGRIRRTWRYCHRCEKAFCSGEHGRFVKGSWVCVDHWPRE